MRRWQLSLAMMVSVGLLAVLAPPEMIGRGFALRGDPQTAAPQLLAATIAIAAWLAVAWLALVLLLAATSALPGVVGRLASRAAGPITPLLLARCLRGGVAVGTAVGSVGIAGGALAAGPGLGPCPPVSAAPANASSGSGAVLPNLDRLPNLERLPNLDRPADGCPAFTAPIASGFAGSAAIPPVARVAAPSLHLVRAGDTLWAIAASELGHRATSAQVATRWPRWWAVNRAEIGPDPNLLLPGEVLHPPAGLGRAGSPY
jgi:hypothetical protein